MEKISVIIPIYNSERYLEKCILSVLNQSYKNFILFLIDDGSTDNSSNICKKFLGDKRVKYFYKKNGGVSSTRNYGINKVTTPYVVFVDSDDTIDNDYLFNYMSLIDKTDLVICGYKEIYKKKIIPHYHEEEFILKNKLFDLLFSDSSICGFLVNKIYKVDIIKKNHLLLNEEIHMCEDLLFNVNYFIHVENAFISSSNSYNYRMRNSSMTWNGSINKKNTLIECLKNIDKILNENNLFNDEYIYFKVCILLKSSIKKTYKMDYVKNDYLYLIKSKNISIGKKIKLFIYRHIKIIYLLYIKMKKMNLKLYD